MGQMKQATQVDVDLMGSEDLHVVYESVPV